jgi:hypothetical protein
VLKETEPTHPFFLPIIGYIVLNGVIYQPEEVTRRDARFKERGMIIIPGIQALSIRYHAPNGPQALTREPLNGPASKTWAFTPRNGGFFGEGREGPAMHPRFPDVSLSLFVFFLNPWVFWIVL